MAFIDRVEFEASDGVHLEGALYGPSTPSKGRVLFVHGFSGHYKDYEPMIVPLSGSYDVVAFNLRGHGDSQGAFRGEDVRRDLAGIAGAYATSTAVGHSAGCTVLPSMSERSVLLEPMCCVDALPILFRSGVRLLCEFPSLRWERAAKRIPVAQHIREPLETSAGLATFDIRDQRFEGPILYSVSAADKMLGYRYASRREKMRDILGRIAPGVEELELPSGLNHCLNYKSLVPFFREEAGKDREAILGKIVEFLDS